MMSRISLTVLASVLMASSPAWATPAHKTHAEASASADDDTPTKPAAKAHAATAGKKSKTADEDAPKGRTAERIKLADDDQPAKSTHGKAAKGKLADSDDTDLVKGAVKSIQDKAGQDKAGHGKAGHDDDDATPAKGKIASRMADVSDDDAPASAKGKKSAHAKASDDDDAAPVKGKASAHSKLADASDDDAPVKGKKSAHAKASDDSDDAPVKGRKSVKLADASDDDAPVKGKKAHAKADDSDDDAAAAKGKKSAHATKLADADDDDAPAKGKKSHVKADESDESDAGDDDTAGFYKKVHGKLVLVSDKDLLKTRLSHHKIVPVDNGPFYHKVHGKGVRVTTVALAEYRKAHRPEADPNATALAAAAHAMTTGTMMPAKLSVVTPMAKMTQPAKAQNPVSQALNQTAHTSLVTLAAVSDALSKLPQSLFNAPGAQPATAAPQQVAAASSSSAAAPAPAMNASPVPYVAMAGQSGNSKGDLSSQDAALYQTAFTEIDHSDFDAAEASLAQVSDKSLVGYAEYHKLANPAYAASYTELTQWLTQYGDQPMAMRVWTMAKRKKPYGAPDPAYPSLMNNAATVAQADADKAVLAAAGSPAPEAAINGVALGAQASLSAAPQTGIDGGAPKIDTRDSDLTPKSARSAYNNGQYEQAVTLASKIGDHWVAGLANWRLKHYDVAEAEFKFVSTDPSRDAWAQSAGAYWASRCADKLNQSEQSQTFLKIAASFPFTFYGLMAEQKLGVTPAVVLAKRGQTPTFAPDSRQELTASLTDDFAWTHGNTQAQRLSALVQIGRAKDAQVEAQSAVQRAGDGTERDHWLALATYNHIQVSQLHATDRLFDATRYPAPMIKLKSGYAVDRALLFAFARKESKFNTKARSYAGAYGLLQLMPGTAALLENNSRFNSHPDMLYTPSVNMRVGQEYMQKLLDGPTVGGDLIRLIAAYNGGPGPVKDAVAQLGPDANDSILLMESIPVAETRQYVEEVAANYWIYHQILDEPNKTLAMAAGGTQVLVSGPAPAPAPAATKTVAEADDNGPGAPGAAN